MTGLSPLAALKKPIKAEHAHILHNIDARDLVLWKCSGLPDDDILEQTLKTIRFDGSDIHLVRLNKARHQISQHFDDEHLSKEPIHILVEAPALGECGIRISCAMLKGLVSSQIRTWSAPK
jgi:hypothetical protein